MKIEQSVLARFEATHELLRKVVSIVGAMEKMGVTRAAKISEISDQLSRITDVVTKLSAKEDKTEVKKRNASVIRRKADRLCKSRRTSDGDVKNILATEEIDSPEK